MSQLVTTLLRKWVQEYPLRRQHLMNHGFAESDCELAIRSATVLERIATFDSAVHRPLSPMLAARFEFCGRLTDCGEIWLALGDISRKIATKRVLSQHRSIRTHWSASAPQLYADGNLSLFGLARGMPDYISYIVWTDSNDEPQIWRYSGIYEFRHLNMVEYLMWLISDGAEGVLLNA